MSESFYVSTAIAYVNAPPHIGHAMEFIQADVLARYKRLCGFDVHFLTGTDEHGIKLYQKAKELGKTAQELTDENAAIFRSLDTQFQLSYDDFIRTTEDRHKKGAQKLWKMIDDAGDFYTDTYAGYYCVGCEAYVTEKDLVDGKCPHHKTKPEWIEEENYYFRLSRYQDQLIELIESDQLRIVPVARKNEILAFIKSGLKDVSFSRPQSVLPWGVEVPNDPEQVMYVWCDALSNYITALGFADDSELFKKYWPADVHLIGKDILRFHAAFWPAMLLSANLPLPKAIYVHGFVTSEGHKMSKSLGNVVDPLAYVDEFGPDALRYYLLREIPTTDDGDFSRERFISLYNADLANNVGNLINRVIMMTHKYFDGAVPQGVYHENILHEISRTVNDYHAHFELYDLREALVTVIRLADYANKYIDEEKPWVLAKEGKTDALEQVMKGLLEVVLRLSMLLEPFLPEKALALRSLFPGNYENILTVQEELLHPGDTIETANPLFPRIDV